MQEFQGGLGRAAFVCGAHDYDRPFVALLYSFASRHAPQTVKPLALYVMLALEYLRKKILQRRHCECGLQRQSWEQAWRVDGHADEKGVGVGIGGLRRTAKGRSRSGTHLGSLSEQPQKTLPGLSNVRERPTGS